MKNNYYICCIIKDEHRYIREFVEHHLKLGFDKIYLFDNHSSHGYNTELHDYIDTKQVEITKWDNDQKSLYNHVCSEEFKQWQENDYMAFIDADEFIYLDEGTTLDSLVARIDEHNWCGLALQWKNYNANEHIKRPAGSLKENYTTLCFESRNWCKCIVKPLYVSYWPSCHYCCPRQNKLYVHTLSGKVVFSKGSCGDSCYSPAHIKHYFTKSWEDWVERLKRGNFTKGIRTVSLFFKLNPDLEIYREELTKDLDYS